MTKEVDPDSPLAKEIRGVLEASKRRDAELDLVLKQHKEDLEKFGKVQEGTKDAVAELSKKGQELQGRLNDLEQKAAKGAEQPADALSLGEQFTALPELKQFAERAQSVGKDRVRWNTKSLGLGPTKVKTVTSVSGSAGLGIWSERLPTVYEEPLRPLSIRQLLDQGTTTSNLIEWVKETLFTNAADIVSGEGTLKPESNIQYERDNVPVRTIAHWIRASKQVLADFPQLETLINGRMRWGLKIKEEDQLLYGDGVGDNILGLIPQATAYNTALNVGTDNMIDTIRHAILQVRLAFYPASGVVMSPIDWHNLELTKDNENRYLMASPSGRLPPMLWGLPVVESDGMSRGNFLVGAFRLAATLLDREQAAIMLSTEDQDNFVRNLVTILIEERLALCVTRPAAFVFGAFPAGSTT
jgi:HK97 family phage major capsid protein